MCYEVKENVPNRIYYNNTKLKWEDFIGKPPVENTYNKSDIIAGIASDFYWQIDSIGSQITSIKLYCFMDKSISYVESYVKEYSSSEEYLLHEQNHFDITFIYTKILERVLKGSKGLTIDKLNNLFVAHHKRMRLYQNRYDNETHYNTSNQLKWNRIIDSLLVIVKKY